ncbi:MAG: ACT domain-containing protein [Saprospiraceae bacterium]|nr:ACT domain-containing protein [Saprospiraceae bacterium]
MTYGFVSKALVDEGISCNVVAAYHHDHIFVLFHDASMAIEVLRKIIFIILGGCYTIFVSS